MINESILNSLNWSAPVVTDGVAVSEAAPNQKFWTAWRADKEAVRAAGVSVKPAEWPKKTWRVIWSRAYDPDDDEVNESCTASSPAATA
jgi:hypothetical protein